MPPPRPVTRPEKLAAARQYVSGARLPATSFTLPSRDLSWTQARDTVYALANLQYFQLDDSALDQFTATRAADGSVAVTPPAEPRPNAGTAADRPGFIKINPPAIRGVQLLYINGFTPAGDIRQTVASVPALDPRLLVLLAWLCETLRNNWGVTRLYHLGFVGDANHGVNNSHNWGRAADFAGVGGADNAGEYDFTVYKHWGRQPVTMPVNWGPINPKTKKHQFQQGQEYPQWPTNFRETTYRLNPSGVQPPFDDLEFAAKVFRDVYHLSAVEGTDTGNTNDRPTAIGRASRFIVHPDHPDSRLRASHLDHIHLQVGPTEHVGFWRS